MAGAEPLIHGLYLSDSLLAWVERFQPDVIYSQLASLSLIRLVEALTRRTGIPLALHFMDDWPTTLYREGLLARHVRRKLDRELRVLIERAALRMVISDDMARAFARRYGCEFTPFHNALDLGDWTAVRRKHWGSGRPFKIMYTGRIGIANEDSILDVARVTEALASDGVDVRFALLTFTGESSIAATLSNLPHVDVLPAIPHDEIPSRLADADLLVLPLDFDERARGFARYSMPTKTVEYMASGTPSLVYGPAGNAVSRYAAAEGWGHVVGTRSHSDLTAALRLLIENGAERERLGRRAVELAVAHHDAGPVREAFRAALQSISVKASCRVRVMLLADCLGNGGAERQLVLLATHLPEEWRPRVCALEGGAFAAHLRDRGRGREHPSSALAHGFAPGPGSVAELAGLRAGHRPLMGLDVDDGNRPAVSCEGGAACGRHYQVRCPGGRPSTRQTPQQGVRVDHRCQQPGWPTSVERATSEGRRSLQWFRLVTPARCSCDHAKGGLLGWRPWARIHRRHDWAHGTGEGLPDSRSAPPDSFVKGTALGVSYW